MKLEIYISNIEIQSHHVKRISETTMFRAQEHEIPFYMDALRARCAKVKQPRLTTGAGNEGRSVGGCVICAAVARCARRAASLKVQCRGTVLHMFRLQTNGAQMKTRRHPNASVVAATCLRNVLVAVLERTTHFDLPTEASFMHQPLLIRKFLSPGPWD